MNFSESLKKNNDFRNVYRNGRSRSNRTLVLYRLENQTDRNRFGISVSKKVGNSVVRHRIARLLRESYRLHENEFERGYDLVVIARSPAKDASYWEIEKSLLYLASRQGVTRKRIQDEKNSDRND